jgi:hypothetical protein
LRTVLRCIPPEFNREEGAPSTVERDIRSKPTGEGARASMREETDASKIPERSFRKRRRNHNGESDELRLIEDTIAAPVQVKLDMGNEVSTADVELTRVRTNKEKLEFLMSLMKAEVDVRSAMRTADGPFLSSLQINRTYIHSQIEETTGITSCTRVQGDEEATLAISSMNLIKMRHDTKSEPISLWRPFTLRAAISYLSYLVDKLVTQVAHLKISSPLMCSCIEIYLVL